MSMHFELSPRDADRWSACPASVRMSRGYPKEFGTSAAEGRAAHDFVHTCFREGIPLAEFKGMTWEATGYPLKITQEVLNYLEPGLERFQELCAGHEPDIGRRVRLDSWLPGETGFLDLACATPDLIIVSSLDYGQSTPVTPAESKHLALYALGYWQDVARLKTRATDFLLVISQPRRPDGGGEWRTNLYDLLAIGGELRAAAERTEDPDAKPEPSEKACRACPVKRNGACPTYDEWRFGVTGLTFNDLSGDEPPALEPPAGMTPERLAYIYKHAAGLRSWISEVDRRVNALAQERRCPGYKLVPGPAGDRYWLDEQKARGWLLSQLSAAEAEVRKIVSPAGAQRMLDRFTWSRLPAGLIGRPEGKPQLVPASDPRPEMPLVAEMFDDLTKED